MVAIVTGKGAGLANSSASVLGAAGQLGSATLGRSGEEVTVNAATGNLVITDVDEMLVGRGPDAVVARAYNSLGAWDGDNNDYWRAGVYRQVYNQTGTYGAGGSTITRTDWDGSEAVYTWNATESLYMSTDGAGAYDMLVKSGSVWTWTDGDSRVTEAYDSANSGRLTSRSDADGNTVSYTYTGGFLTRVTTSGGEYTSLVYGGTAGNQLLSLVTSAGGAVTRTYYTYESTASTARLIQVLVNLDPSDNSSAGASYKTTYTYDGSTKRIATIAQDDGTLLAVSYALVGSDYRVSAFTQTVATGLTRTTSFAYDTTALTTKITDSAGQTTLLAYDASGNLLKIVSPPVATASAPLVSEFHYEADGDVDWIRQGGATTTFTYGGHGNRKLERDAAGNTITRSFNANNQMTSEKHFLGPDLDGAGSGAATLPVPTYYVYDAKNHLRYVLTAEGRVTEYRYDGFGQQISQISYTGTTYPSTTPDFGTLASLDKWVSGTADRAAAQRTDTWYDFRGNVARTVSYAALDGYGEGSQDPAVIVGATGTTVQQQADGLYRVTKTGGVDLAFNTEARSSTGADGDFVLQLRPVTSGTMLIGGVAGSPSGAGYANPNYGFYFQNDGAVNYMESGSNASLGATYTAGDNFWLVRTGSTIAYYKGATLAAAMTAGAFRTVSGATGTLYFDSSVYVLNASLDAGFTPQPIVAGANASVVQQPDGLYRLTKTGGTNGVWNSEARGATVTSGDFVLQSRPVAAGSDTVTGVSTAPGTSASYTDLAYAFYLHDSGTAYSMDASGWIPLTTWVPGDNFWLARVGSTISYYKGATLEAAVAAGALRTVTGVSGSFGFDSSLYYVGNAVDVAFTRGSVPASDVSRTDYVYDAAGHLLSRAISGQGVESFVYDGLSRITSSKDFNGATTSVAFNDTAGTTAVTLANGLVQTSTYDRAGELVSYAESGTGVATATTTYGYDNLGRLRTVLDPTGKGRYYFYDAIGRKTAEADGDGSLTEYRYDGNSNVTSSTTYAGKLTSAQIANLASAYAPYAIVTGANTSVVQQSDGLFRLTKTSGTNAEWDADARGSVSTAGDFVVQIRPTHINWDVTVGVSSAPGTSSSYSDMNYGLRLAQGGGVYWREGGSAAALSATWAAGENFWIARTGSTINYYKGATLALAIAAGALRTVTGVSGSFAFDSSLYYSVSSVDVAFTVPTPSLDAIRPTASTDDRWTWNSYDLAQRLVQTIDGTGATTVYVYDGLSQLVSTTQRATPVDSAALTALKAAALNPNLWANPENASLWEKGGVATPTSAGTIDGAPAFLFTATGNSGLIGSQPWIPVAIGDTVTMSFWIMAGTVSANQFGLYGTDGSFGINDDRRVAILSGPGTVTQGNGLYDLSGLSTTVPTLVTMSRTYATAGYAIAYIYVPNSYGTGVAGNTLVIAKPVLSYDSGSPVNLPSANAADRATRLLYDSDGHLVGTLDAEGYLTEAIYDGAGRKVRTIAYADDVDPSVRASGSLSSLRSNLTQGTSDIYQQWLYDARGLVRATVDGEGTVTRSDYAPAGYLIQQVGGQKVTPTTTYTLATLPAAGGSDILSTTAWTRNLYGQALTETRTLTGSTTTTTAYSYDNMRRLVSTVTQSGGADPRTYSQRYDLQGRLTSELSAAGNVLLAASPGSIETIYAQYGTSYTYDAAGRLTSKTGPAGIVSGAVGAKTLYYYNADDALAYEVGSTGEVVEYRYNAFGERADIVVYGGRVSLTGLTGGTNTAPLVALLPSVLGTTDSLSHVEFNVDGTVARSTDPLSYITSYTYDAFGEAVTQSAAFDDDGPSSTARSILTKFSYDRRGLLKTQIVDPGTGTGYRNLQTSYGYDAFGRAVLLTNALNQGTTSTYDRKGRLTATTDALSHTTGYAYDARDNLVTVTDALLNVTRFVYDKDNRKVATIDALGGLTTTAYDADGRVVATREYKNPVSLTSLATEVAETNTTFTAALAHTDAADRVTRYVYDKDGQLRFTVDALMHVVEHGYDAQGREVRTIAYDGTISAGTSSFTETNIASLVAGLASAGGTRTSHAVYDAADRLNYAIDALGQVTWFVYDTKGQLIKQVAFAATYLTPGDPLVDAMDAWRGTSPVTSLSASDRTTLAYYDKKGQLAYSVDAAGFVTRYDYDKRGNLKSQIAYMTAASGLSETTPLTTLSGSYTIPTSSTLSDSRRTTFTYDTAGRLTDTAEYLDFNATPTRIITHLELDALGQVTASTDSYGTDAHVVRYIYDGVGRVVSETVEVGTGPTSDDLVTTYTYDAVGNAVQVNDRRGNSSSAYYDALGRQLSARDAESYITDTSYTAFGEVASVTRHSVRATNTAVAGGPVPVWTWSGTDVPVTTAFEYDKLGQLTKTIDALTNDEQYTYGSFGERLSVRNKLGNTTNYTYDKHGLLLTETLPVTTKTAGGSTISVVNSYRYDARGNRIKMIEAGVFDGSGNLDTTNSAAEARTTTFAYDKLDRLTTTTHDAVDVVKADLTVATGKTPTETNIYDGRGNVIETTQTVDTSIADNSAILAHTWFLYDALDRKIGQVDALGTLSRFTYDTNGNLVSAKVYATPLSTLPPTTTDWAGSGTARETIYVYDRANRLVSTTVASLLTGEWTGSAYTTATGSVGTSMAYDKAGNVTREVDGRGNSVYHWYDKLGRAVAQVDAENYLTTWDRDAEGNVRTEIRYADQIASSGEPFDATTPVTTLVGYADDDASHDRTTTFTYDKNGRRLTETRALVVAYSIDGSGVAHQELDLISGLPKASTVTYTYDGLGQILTKTEANTDTTVYTYDKIGRLTLEAGQSFTDYTGGTVTPRTAYSYDGLNNLKATRVQIDASGTNEVGDRITTYTYGAGGRLATMTDAYDNERIRLGVSGVVPTRSYGYDLAGRTVRESWTRVKSDGSASVTEAAVTRYDLAGRAITQTSARFDGSAWVFTDETSAHTAYDAVRIQYNAYGEMTGRGLTAGPAVGAVYQETFDYDAAGRLWRSNSGDGTLRFHIYNKAGNETLTLASAGADLTAYTVSTYADLISTSGGIVPVGTAITASNAVTTLTVYDKRGQAIETREPDRAFATGTTPAMTTGLIVHAKAYNAFGEVTSETSPLGYDTSGSALSGVDDYRTKFEYNTMGRLTKKSSAKIDVTGATGTTSSGVRAIEEYGYDLSGRLVSVIDANAYRTTRMLLAGTGHGDSEALIAKEFHPTGLGMFETKYDVFGDARILRNELYSDEAQTFDKMGRVVTIQRRGGLLTDSYGYDGLGQRTTHYNSQFGASYKERTDYDVQGRVVSSYNYAGDQTTTTYSWDGSLQTSIAGSAVTLGGWTKTVSTIADRASSTDAIYASVEKQDYFRRAIDRTDMGGRDYDFAYDRGGRLTDQVINSSSLTTSFVGHTGSYTYFNTGRVAVYSEGDPEATGAQSSRTVTSYMYDQSGNMRADKLMHRDNVYTPPEYEQDPETHRRILVTPGYYTMSEVTWRDGRATYDTLGRMTSYKDVDSVGNSNVEKTWAYDAASNVRQMSAKFRPLNANGTTGALPSSPNQVYWYAYDGRDRVVVTKGTLSGGAIVRGAEGTLIAYDAADRRVTVIDASGTQGFNYRDDGQLMGMLAGGATRAIYDRDALGRVIDYKEYNASASLLGHRWGIVYDVRGQVLTEFGQQKQGTDWTYNHTVNFYDAAGTGTVPGAALTSTANAGSSSGSMLYGSQTKYWTTTNGSYALQYGVSFTPDANYPDSTTQRTYIWQDGALLNSETLVDRNGSSLSGYGYTGAGHIRQVGTSTSGTPRTAWYQTDGEGRITEREQIIPSGSSNAPSDKHYYFGGERMGDLSDNGTANLDYIASVAARSAAPGTGIFRGGATSGTAYADFDQSYDPFNGSDAGTSASYTVAAGDTLAGIAAALWGDSSLWYALAAANGLTGTSTLVAGQTLTIPNNVYTLHNKADTWRPYNPNDALGDTSPHAPKPPKKNGCGVLGQIVLIAIAVAVSALLTGPLSGAVGSLLAGGTVVAGSAAALGGAIIGGALAAAAGSIVSQSFGLATGLQTGGFSWKGVALAALGGGIGGGLGQIGSVSQPATALTKAADLAAKANPFGTALKAFASGVARGVAGNLVSQDIANLTHLQKGFDYLGVALAGLGGGVGAATGSLVPGGRVGSGVQGLATGMASGIANATARSLITGTDFGDNLMSALPDILGTTIGNAVAGGIRSAFEGGSADMSGVKLSLGGAKASAADFQRMLAAAPGDISNVGPVAASSFFEKLPARAGGNGISRSSRAAHRANTNGGFGEGITGPAFSQGSTSMGDGAELAGLRITFSTPDDLEDAEAVRAVVASPGSTLRDVLLISRARGYNILESSVGPVLKARDQGRGWSVATGQSGVRDRTWGEWIAETPVAAAFVGAANVITLGGLDELTGAINSWRTGNSLDVEIAKADMGKQLLAQAHPVATFVGNVAGGALVAPLLPEVATSSGMGLFVTGVTGGATFGYLDNNDDRVGGAIFGAITGPFLSLGGKAAAPYISKLGSTVVNSASRRFFPAAAESGPLAGSIRTVNPSFPARGFNQNCVECVIATEQRFAGTLGATAKPTAGPLPIARISDQFGGSFQTVSGPMEIGSILGKAGNGSRGIVYGADSARGFGHVWNVRMDNGVVRFLDSQPAQRAGQGVNNFNDFTDFQFILTSPGRRP